LIDLRSPGGSYSNAMIALEFPAYLIQHHAKVLWLMHTANTREVVNETAGDTAATASVLAGPSREVFLAAERELTADARAIRSMSVAVSYQIRRRLALDTPTLYPPPPKIDGLAWLEDDGFLLVPVDRLSEQRVRLVLEALALAPTRIPARLLSTRSACRFDEEVKAAIARLDLTGSVSWLGTVGEHELAGLYARCRAALYPPVAETLAWETMYAMQAAKPMITCSDSGATAELVRHGETGWIVQPDPEALAVILERAWNDPGFTRVVGRSARQAYDDLELSWPRVARELLDEVAP
jgi:glycosyltransferase involved in cell wall biosynthesis